MSSNEIFISTERLILSAIKLTDAGAMFKYRSNPIVFEYQNWRPIILDDVEKFIIKNITSTPNIPNTWYQLKEYNEMIGGYPCYRELA